MRELGNISGVSLQVDASGCGFRAGSAVRMVGRGEVVVGVRCVEDVHRHTECAPSLGVGCGLGDTIRGSHFLVPGLWLFESGAWHMILLLWRVGGGPWGVNCGSGDPMCREVCDV